MTAKNKDGFAPGQDLSFEDLMALRAVPNPRRIPSREEVAKMPKPELVEWLEAHGIEGPEGGVADLRKSLTSILYVEGEQ